MSSISPWSTQGAAATTIGVATIVCISATPRTASLAWGVATLATAALLTSVVGAIDMASGMPKETHSIDEEGMPTDRRAQFRNVALRPTLHFSVKALTGPAARR